MPPHHLFEFVWDPTANKLVREIYCDKGLTFKCRHIIPVPAHMAMGVRARDFHVIEYTTSLDALVRRVLGQPWVEVFPRGCEMVEA